MSQFTNKLISNNFISDLSVPLYAEENSGAPATIPGLNLIYGSLLVV